MGSVYPKTWFTVALRRLGALVLGVTAIVTALPAEAQMASAGSGQFRHDRWMTYEGAPTQMRGLAQTPDGWLWIAAAEGLFRFDGVSFEQIAVSAGSSLERASAGPMLVTRSGELWVGYGQGGGVAVYRNGHLHSVPMPRTPMVINSLAETPDGAIWAAANLDSYRENRVRRFEHGRWEDADTRFGLPDGYPSKLCVMANGTLWLTLSHNRDVVLAYLTPGARRFSVSTRKLAAIAGCIKDRQNRLWINDGTATRLFVGPDGKVLARPTRLFDTSRVMGKLLGTDSGGAFWGHAREKGISYIPDPARARKISERPWHFSAADGLSSDTIFAFLADRDDNIWITSELGLDRFRRAAAVQEPSPLLDASLGLGISRTGDAIYIAGRNLSQFSPGAPRKLLSGDPDGLCAAGGKGVWVVYGNRIVHFDKGKQWTISRPPGVALTGVCAEDRENRLWLGLATGGLMWHDARGWHVPRSPLPKVNWGALLVTQSGNIAYTTTNELVQLIGDDVAIMPLSAYNLGMITNLSAGGHDFFLSGSNGLLRIRGKQVARLDWRQFPWVARLRDFLQTPSGDTWMMRAGFTSRVATADLERAFDNPNAPLERTIFDMRDGLGPMQGNDIYTQQMAVGADGIVWQLNRNGASRIDPGSRMSKAPPVLIRSLTVGNTVMRDPSTLLLAAGTHSFDIAYTALDYSHPERVRFRYRLEGVDDEWVDAGDRRLASYANLKPGHYRFRVITSDDQRVWSNPAAKLDIEIRPTFFQSWPFTVLCGMLLLGLLWLGYSLRLRSVADRIRMAMAERIAERERIARELHDTLLQGIQGLMLRFQVVADRVEDPETRRSLDRALDQADAVVVEGRERVRDLRSGAETSALVEKLQNLVGSIVDGETPRIDLSINGDERSLHALVTIEALRIAEEAIRNAVVHAGSASIFVSLEFGRKQFGLSVRDTGVGIPKAVLSSGKRSARFGIVGMRERAKRIAGELRIVTAEGQGTDVILTVPARSAYPGVRLAYLTRVQAIFPRWRDG
jgi:signal transduction histidine kinase